METEKFMTIQEAVSVYKVSEMSIRNAIKRKRLPAERRFNAILFTHEDFNAWHAQEKKKGRPKKTETMLPNEGNS